MIFLALFGIQISTRKFFQPTNCSSPALKKSIRGSLFQIALEIMRLPVKTKDCARYLYLKLKYNEKPRNEQLFNDMVNLQSRERVSFIISFAFTDTKENNWVLA